MLVTWIVPFYDLEPWLLHRCLRSIIAASQGHTYEIIVVDDGSTRHHAAEVTGQYTDAPIRLIRQPNGGLSAARNTGMEAARGEYLGFVDGDDALSATYVPQALDLLQTEQPDLLIYDAQKFSSRPLPQATAAANLGRHITRTPTAAELMATRNLAGAAWLNLIRRDLRQRHGWTFPLGVFHEDGPFTTRVYYYAATTIYLEVPAYLYYQRPGSIMHNRTTAHVERRLDDFMSYVAGVHQLREEHRHDATPTQQAALERKLRLLAGDYLRAMLRIYYPQARIEQRLQELRPLRLYPFTAADRGLKYRTIATLGNHRWGRYLLYAAEAVMKHHSKL